MRKKTNPQLNSLIIDLRRLAFKEKVRLWGRIAEDLEKPRRHTREVNLYKIDKYAKEGEFVVVPGKVLGVGDLTKSINVSAFKFSKQALEKISKNGKAWSLRDLMEQNPKANKVRILG